MAKLGTQGMTLEITYPYERADAVIVDFRVQWHGRDIIRPEVLDRWANRPVPKDVVFSAWQHNEDRLSGVMRRAVAETRPTYWEPIDPAVSITCMPDGWNMYTLQQILNDEKELARTQSNLQRKRDHPAEDDYFLVLASFNADTYLTFNHDMPCQSGGVQFTIGTTRSQLRAFADQLQEEHETCRKERKMDLTDYDAFWRALH